MQVFKLFFRIARSKIGIAALYLIVFTAICFPLVYSSQEQTSFKENSLSLYIRDDDQTEASKSLIEQLAKKNTIVEMSDDRQAILDAMYYGLVDYSLVIQKGYEEMLGDLSGEESDSAMFESYHMHDSYSVAMMDLFFSDYVRNVRMNLAVGKSLPEAIRTTEEEMAKEIPVEIVADPEKAIKDENFTENFAVFFRMMAYVLFAVITNVLCPILLKLNEGDQRKRIECSRVSVSSFITQSFVASAVVVILIWAVFMAAGMIVYGGMYKGTNCAYAVIDALLFSLMSAMFSIFVCSFRPGLTAVGMISQIVGLGMSFLCGAFIPQTMLGSGVLAIGKLFPVYWYVRATDLLSGAQTGTMTDVWICFGVLAGYILLFLLLTILKTAWHPRTQKNTKTAAVG